MNAASAARLRQTTKDVGNDNKTASASSNDKQSAVPIGRKRNGLHADVRVNYTVLYFLMIFTIYDTYNLRRSLMML